MTTPLFPLPKSLPARLTARLRTIIENQRLQRLPDPQKEAVLGLLYGIALADGVLSNSEQQALEQLAARAGIAWTVVDDIGLTVAVERLNAHKGALRLACLLCADAFFVDGDFDAAEQRFVDGFQQRFKLPGNPLKEAVETLRQRHLDDALQAWDDEIRNG